MIVNDSNVKSSKFVPMWTGDGRKVINVLALEATTAKMPGALVVTTSGYGYQSFAGASATGTNKFAVSLESGTSGEYIDVAIAGYVSGVCISGTGGLAAIDTYTKGNAVELTDTGHLVDYGATWSAVCNMVSTVQQDAGACVGIALSSGNTTSIDLFIIEKPYISCNAT